MIVSKGCLRSFFSWLNGIRRNYIRIWTKFSRDERNDLIDGKMAGLNFPINIMDVHDSSLGAREFSSSVGDFMMLLIYVFFGREVVGNTKLMDEQRSGGKLEIFKDDNGVGTFERPAAIRQKESSLRFKNIGFKNFRKAQPFKLQKSPLPYIWSFYSYKSNMNSR